MRTEVQLYFKVQGSCYMLYCVQEPLGENMPCLLAGHSRELVHPGANFEMAASSVWQLICDF